MAVDAGRVRPQVGPPGSEEGPDETDRENMQDSLAAGSEG